jgi:hypothetical protein
MPLKHEDREIIVLGTLTVFIIIVAIIVGGCATLRPARHDFTTAASSPERCASLAAKAEVQHILAIVFSGLGTGAAAVSPAISNTTAQDVLLGSSSALGVVGAVLSYTGGVASATYAKECP